MKDNNFNPEDVQKYFGKSFITKSGSVYGLTSKGKFTGRPSIEGAEIMLIAGIEERLYWDVRSCLNTSEPGLKNELDDIIREHGQEIKPGLMLVVSLTPKSVKQKDRYGLITSIVKDIKDY